MRPVRVTITALTVTALGVPALGGGAHAAPTASPCTAVPAGLALLTAGDAGVATVTGGVSTPIATAGLPGPAQVAARGPDGTVWLSAGDSGPDGPTTSVYRLGADGVAVPSSAGDAWLSAVGWLDGRTVAVIVDADTAADAGTSGAVGSESYGAVIVESSDGDQRVVKPAGGPEYGVSAMTLAGDRLVESAYADLTEAITYVAPDGTRRDDWFTPTAEAAYNAPPLYQWAVAATPPADPAAAPPTLTWVEGPDWDGTTGEITGGWRLAWATDPASPGGVDVSALDLGEQPGSLLFADFDGRFWVGTFSSGVDPAPDAPARVIVVDLGAAVPTVADAGCVAGTTATIDRLGRPAPAPAPSTTAPAPSTTAAPAPCTYVAATDAFPLRRCDKGAAVRAVQEQLRAHGYDLDADGYFGPATEAAVRDFQSAHGLEVDGLVGPATWSALYTGEPAGSDADGDGTVEPWELGGSPGGGAAGSYVGLVYTLAPSSQDVIGPDGQPVPGLRNLGGVVVGDGSLPVFVGEHVVDDDSTMLWLARIDVRNPDGSRGPATVVAAVDVPVDPGRWLDLGECQAGGVYGAGIAATVSDAEIEGGDYLAHQAWRLDPAAGAITEIDATTVRCAVIGD